ncbi:MAG: hypothetical protein AAF561_10635 [Planctomycetota bacterium]
MKKMPDKYRQLVEVLLEKTAQGKVDWSESARSSFSFSTDSRSINILDWYDDDAERFSYSLSIRDELGNIIDSFVASPSADGFDLLQSLHDAARRSARDIEQTINDLLGVLQAS